MAIKLDMTKAYDRVKWAFLEASMRRLGFAENWITLIMTCVTTVSYSILINGHPSSPITPTRGLRQGDPLSPYIFLLCAECLSSLLFSAEQEKFISGVPISGNDFRFSHLFFADDNLLFCQANFQEWGNIMKLLHQYELASGHKLNSAKTAIYFSKNTSRGFQEFIGTLVGISATRGFEKYLGLPIVVGQSKNLTFVGIYSRVHKRLEGWKERFLSSVGKEIVIKVVIQAILIDNVFV